MTLQTETSASGLRYLKGIGPKRAAALEKLGIHSVRDLLYFFPRRYEDRSQLRTMEQLNPGEIVTVKGEISAVRLKRIRHLTILEVAAGDLTGFVHAVWFNQPYLKDQFHVGQQVIFYGRVELYQKRLQLTSPEYEIIDGEEEALHTGRITPIYPLTEGLFQRSLRSLMHHLVDTQLEREVQEWLPDDFLKERNFTGLQAALRQMHFPVCYEDLQQARRRLIFDEFLIFELILFQKIERMKNKYRAYSIPGGEDLAENFQKSLPFTLTNSQKKALEDLSRDLAQPFPMNRLLQGDVGSGKTVVAAFALLMAASRNLQGALLVPTEILAQQHFRTLSGLLRPFSVSVALLTSSTPGPKRERLLAELKQGKISVLIGTHALLQEDVHFKALALLGIDEQHKFGVHQRCQLLARDPRPHQLVMTATPIPRTLALTVYGDLEVSVMNELPRGRKPIRTFWVKRQRQPEILGAIRQKIGAGEQAYFIFPLIEETEKMDLSAATREYENLRKGVFAGIRMGLVHGRLPNEERDAVMKSFRSGDVKILVATSVVEVGVDNPNATMMVIENSERFGLSQLHQMRGRIGRGDKASECYLFGEPKTEEGRKRLKIMTESQDGFFIAEEDLKLRGPGDVLGVRQSGEFFFRVANPISDQEALLEARDWAKRIVQGKLWDEAPEWEPAKKFLEQFQLRY